MRKLAQLRNQNSQIVLAVLAAITFFNLAPTCALGQAITNAAVVANPRPVRHPAEQIQFALQKAQFPACGETNAEYYRVEKSQIAADNTGFGYSLHVSWWSGFRWRRDDPMFNFQFANLQQLTIEPGNTGFRITLPISSQRSTMCVAKGGQTWLVWSQKEDAKAFADAVNWLIWSKSADGKASIDRDAQSLSQQLQAWKSGARPTMPDDAHVHEVLAENAVREKNPQRAIDEYDAALEIFPTWPEGQFNMALLCGETGDYDCAVAHMQIYLELVPGSQDAQAAKDKLIIWKDKLAHSQ